MFLIQARCGNPAAGEIERNRLNAILHLD